MKRLFSNIGWLLGGRGFNAVMSLVYLYLATHTLGLEGFGHFALIVALGQAITGVILQKCGAISEAKAFRYTPENVDFFDVDFVAAMAGENGAKGMVAEGAIDATKSELFAWLWKKAAAETQG